MSHAPVDPTLDTAPTAPQLDDEPNDEPTDLVAQEPAPAPVEAYKPVVTTAVVPLALEQGVLVIADSAVFDESHWKSPHSQNVQSGWAVDVSGPSAKELAHRVAATWKKEELVDGTWRITVSNDNEARNLRDKVSDLIQTNPEMQGTVTVTPRDCSITRVRDAARGLKAAGLMLGGGGGRQIVGIVGPRHVTVNAKIHYEDGVAKKIEIAIP